MIEGLMLIAAMIAIMVSLAPRAMNVAAVSVQCRQDGDWAASNYERL